MAGFFSRFTPIDDWEVKGRWRIMATCFSCGKESDISNILGYGILCPYCKGYLVTLSGKQKIRFYTLLNKPKKPKERVFIRSWGKHTNGVKRLRYRGGSYAKLENLTDGRIISISDIEILCKSGAYNIESYVRENGYVEGDISDKTKQIKKRNPEDRFEIRKSNKKTKGKT